MYSTAVQRIDTLADSAGAALAAIAQLPPFSPAVGDGLLAFWTALSTHVPSSPEIKTLADNARQTVSLWNDLDGMTGQKFISLFQYTERIDFFWKALSAIKAGQSLPNDALGLFREDELGTPLSWHKLDQVKTSRTESAHHHTTLFKLATQCDEWKKDPTSMTIMGVIQNVARASSSTISASSATNAPSAYQERWGSVQHSALTDLHEGNTSAAIACIEEEISSQLTSLFSVETINQELLRRISIRCYSQNSTLPDATLWGSIDAIAKSWVVSGEQSYDEGYKTGFSREELLACLEQHGGSLLTLSLDQKLSYFAVVYSDPDRIPKVTAEKIEKAVDAGFITAEKRDCWVYLVARDKHVSNSLHRLAHIDWYSTFMEAVGDVVISNGGERIVGRVLQSNSARSAHLRAGAQSTGAYHVDENRNSSEIIAQELIPF